MRYNSSTSHEAYPNGSLEINCNPFYMRRDEPQMLYLFSAIIKLKETPLFLLSAYIQVLFC